MFSALVRLLYTGTVLLLFCNGHGMLVSAWNRQFFNRYARNYLREDDGGGAPMGNGNNEMNELKALFNMGNNAAAAATDYRNGVGNVAGGKVMGGQQAEVYGIVEPLIEDLPCVDRPCSVNDDCCPTGVCVNTYGEGKCIYVYGRKRDFCQRHSDCELGLSCSKGILGNLICQPTTTSGLFATGTGFELKQFNEDCISSSECNVAKGMCCQLQRNHHRMLPRKLCTYFRDPFMCIDIMPTTDYDMNIKDARFFSQRRM